MGYTHYWERPSVLPRPQFIAAVDDCRRLCAGLAVPLGGADGQGEPTFSATQICFNGHVDSGEFMLRHTSELHPGREGIAVVGQADAVAGWGPAGSSPVARMLGPGGDGSYEAFRVELVSRLRYPQDPSTQQWCGGYCKTNCRLYDLCVQACLIVLSHYLGGDCFRVSSDAASREWNDARYACQRILGYGIDWGDGKLAPVRPPSSTG